MMMGKTILVSGLVNMETTVSIRQFPIPYYPIDYPFFGVNAAPSGVALNLTKALRTLGDDVRLLSMTGDDFAAAYIRDTLRACGVDASHVVPKLRQTPSSAVLYDGEGRRQVYSDLKDIQETAYSFAPEMLGGVDLVAACNINFNRPLLAMAREAGLPIATDVHVLRDIEDGYNREFMEAADILFMSDEGVGEDYSGFVWELAHRYDTRILVIGRGGRGAAIYLREEQCIYELPAAHVGPVVNTVGAGDALFSAFLHYTADGYEPVEALVRAELFASAKIAVSGAAQGFAAADEMERLYAQHAGQIYAGIVRR